MAAAACLGAPRSRGCWPGIAAYAIITAWPGCRSPPSSSGWMPIAVAPASGRTATRGRSSAHAARPGAAWTRRSRKAIGVSPVDRRWENCWPAPAASATGPPATGHLEGRIAVSIPGTCRLNLQAGQQFGAAFCTRKELFRIHARFRDVSSIATKWWGARWFLPGPAFTRFSSV